MIDPEYIRAQFPSAQVETYFNSAGATLCPLDVRNEVCGFLDTFHDDIMSGFSKYVPRGQRLRRNLATMLGADTEEVAVLHHTAEGVSVIANGLEWQSGDKILTLSNEYPSTIYPWMNLEKRFGVQLVQIQEQDGRCTEDEIISAIRRERPRLFAISAVEWTSGYRFDLEPIGRVCEELDVFFFVDAAQATGFCEVDVRAWRASALAGSAWKWLFGPTGLGYLYLRRDLLDSITPIFVGSESVVQAQNYDEIRFEFQPDMRRFEYSSDNLSALVWFDAGVRFVMNLGLDNIREHVFALQDETLEQLQALGCETRGGGQPERRSGIIAFLHPQIDSKTLTRRMLKQAGLFAQPRDGFVRLAFHGYTTAAAVNRVMEFLKSSC